MGISRLLAGSITALLFALSSSAVHAQGKTGTVKLGINEQLSGTFVAVGLPPAAAVRMAVKEINEKGFVVGDTTYRFQLSEVDNRSQTPAAVAGMTKLVEDDKVKAVFGPTIGAFAVQTIEITNAAKVIHFSPATPWQSLGHLSGNGKPYLFGTQNALSLTSAFDLRGLTSLGVKKVAFLSFDDDTTRGNLPGFLAAAKNAGVNVVTVLAPQTTVDWSSFVTRAKSENVDGIYFLYPAAQAASVLRAVLELNVPIKAFGGRALEPTVAVNAAGGKPLPFTFFSTLPTPSFDYPANARTKAFADHFKAFDPAAIGPNSGFAFWAYDYVYMLAEAMKQAGTVEDTTKIAATLSSMTYDGVAGKICFGKDMRTASLDGGQVFVRAGKIEAVAIPSSCK